MNLKLKFVGILGVLASFAFSAQAAVPLVGEAPIKGYGTPTTVTVSTSAWTRVPAASSLTGRAGLLVALPASSNANMEGHLGSCTSTSVAKTVRPIELIKGTGFVFIPASDNVCLYLLSLDTAAENVHVQEVKQ